MAVIGCSGGGLWQWYVVAVVGCGGGRLWRW